MPVLTRKMRKEAGLPALPARFPLDVPSIPTRHPTTPTSGSRPKPRPAPVPRSTRPLASPIVLSSPTRFDTPSPLPFFTSGSSQRTRASAHSSASSATRIEDLAAMHPGVQKLQRQPDEKWMFTQDGGTVRICMTPHRGALFGVEWDILGASDRARSPSSDATIRITPASSRASPEAVPRTPRRRPGGSPW